MNFLWILTLMLTGKVLAELTSKDASEGPCNPDIADYVAKDIDFAKLGKTTNYYVPMGSQAMYRHYGEVFLGRPLMNYTELAEMQLRIKFTFGVIAYNTAFPNRKKSPYFSQKCPAKDGDSFSGQLVCKPICGSGSPSTNLRDPGIRQTLDSIIYTDNKGTMLITRCPSDDVQDYKVLSTNKTISEPVKTIILDKIRELEFSLTKLYYMHYD